MNKISESICKPRKQTNLCIVSMFWPKQMYDRNTSPNPRRRSKEQIVLSTCVGYRRKKNQPNPDSFLLGPHNKKEHHIFDNVNCSACQFLWMSSCQATETVRTSLLNYFAIAWTLQCSQVDRTGILFVIWTVLYEHWSSRKQKILCVHNRVSFYFWLPSGLLLCLTGDKQLNWQQSKPNSWLFLPSKCISRQEVRMLLLC